MATFSKTGKEVVMVGDRSGIHRAHKLDATLEHYHSKLRFHFLPAHCGHHLMKCPRTFYTDLDTLICKMRPQAALQRWERTLRCCRPAIEWHTPHRPLEYQR